MSVEMYEKRSSGYLSRSIFGTEDESLHAVGEGQKLWTLEESLTVSAQRLLIDYPMSKSTSKPNVFTPNQNPLLLSLFLRLQTQYAKLMV